MNPNKSFIQNSFKIGQRIVPAVVVLAIMAAGWFAVHELDTSNGDTLLESSADTEPGEQLLELPEAKIVAGGINASAVEPREIQHVHTVPGRLRYDESRHVDVKAPTVGILMECLVKPGDCVEAGQLLAVINSPEIGKARADVLKVEAEYQLIERQAARQQQVTNNLARLFGDLDSGKTVDQAEAQYAEKPLGEYRDLLLAAWTKKLLAEQLAKNARPLAEKGSIPARTLQEREAERQIAESAFRTVKDKVRFDSRQDRDRLQNEQVDAQRRVKIARQHLETLLGYPEKKIPKESSTALSRLEVRAPFAGTIENRVFAKSERVSQGDSLFVLADTGSLYVAANIRENDWPAVLLQSGQELTVSAPAIADTTFKATVHYVGRQVDVASNSVRLVATIQNDSGLLRPGMFVRVSVPIGDARQALAVRPQSVMQHENEQFVFVAMNDRTFQRVDIVTGQASTDWVEIQNGLQPGQQVVDEGAFLLKSELLLEGEEE